MRLPCCIKYFNANFMVNEPCGDINYPDGATYISTVTGNSLRANEYAEADVPDGADVVAIYFRTNAAYTASDDPMLTAQSFGINIEFIPAE